MANGFALETGYRDASHVSSDDTFSFLLCRADLRRPHPHTYPVVAAIRQYQPDCGRGERTRDMDCCDDEANAHRDELFQLSILFSLQKCSQLNFFCLGIEFSWQLGDG